MHLLCALLVGMLASGPAWAHGLERQYGTPINGAGAGARAGSGGSPAFTLLALEATSAAMDRALDEGRTADIHERARRLSQMVLELRRRSQNLEPDQRQRVAEAVALLSARADRVYATAGDEDPTSLRRELTELRKLVGSMHVLLRETAP